VNTSHKLAPYKPPPKVHKFDREATAASVFRVDEIQTVAILAYASKKWIMAYVIAPLQAVDKRIRSHSFRRAFALNIRCKIFILYNLEKPTDATLQRINVIMGWSEGSAMLFEYSKDYRFWSEPGRYQLLPNIANIIQWVMFASCK
jgi:hypothetical protein